MTRGTQHSPSTLRIVAEVNSSHFGNVDAAFEACEVAMSAGATDIKFQSWSSKSLFTSAYLVRNPIEAKLYSKFSLDTSVLNQLRVRCQELGLGFGSTAYSADEIQDLAEMNADFIKIASMDIVSLDLLERAAKTGLKVVLSTGMSTFDEVREAVDVFLSAGGTNLTLLHCTSIYPTPIGSAALGNWVQLQNDYGAFCEVGFSDHTKGTEAAVALAALNCRFFEKHLSLDKSRPGFDNEMAEDRVSFERYASYLRSVTESLLIRDRVITPEEALMKLKMRRSAHYVSSLSPGQTLTLDSIEMKRPGTGMYYSDALDLVGRRLRCRVEGGELLKLDHFES